MRPTGAARAAPASADGDPQIERFGGQLGNDHSSVDPATQSLTRHCGARSGRPGVASDAPRASAPVDFDAINKAALAAFPAVLARLLPGGKRVGAELVALNPCRADRHLGSFKALDRLQDIFDQGFDTLAAKVEALPIADCRPYPETYTDDGEDNRVDHLEDVLLDLHLIFRRACKLLRQALLSSSTK
jgi:hypothetical protein